MTHFLFLITPYFFLAHGALGDYDELAFLGIIVIFLLVVLYTWFRSRSMNYEEQDLMPPPSAEQAEERFKLD